VQLLQIDDAGQETVVGVYQLPPGSSVDVALTQGVAGRDGEVRFTVLSGAVPVTVNGATRTLRPGPPATIPIDRTPPRVACGAPDNRWHADNINVVCVAKDDGVGLVSAADAAFALTTAVEPGAETATADTDTKAICDVAANCFVTGPIGPSKIDRKAPAIIIASPAANAAYVLNQSVAAAFQCADAGSGVAACDGAAPSGGRVPTGAVGTSAFSVTAADQVGNASSASIRYAVTYGILPLYDQARASESGSTIPIKVRLIDAAGANHSSLAIVVTARSVGAAGTRASTTAQHPGNATTQGTFRYDATLDGYIFNLISKGLAAGTYEMSFVVSDDPIEHAVSFRVR
jgi:hypothetical protein